MRDNEFRRLKNFTIIAGFVVAVVLTFLSLNFTLDMPTTTTMDSATIPVVMMKTENGTFFNSMHGYTSEVDATLLNDCITPLPEDKKQKIVISTYGEEVKKISYRIRKFEDMSLVEDTTVSGTEQNGDSIDAVLNIKNLIDSDTEYLLEISLETGKYQKISYFSKIISSSNIGLQSKIDFVMNFNACTFDKGRIDEISSYLESKTSADNSNFGKVNINSSKAMIGWGSLNPKTDKTIIPCIKEINSEIASIVLKYTMAAQGKTGDYDSYKVDEYYRIRQTTSKMFLLNFEREANQIFDSENDLSKTQGISLGITSSESYDTKSSSKGTYSCFVTQGVLWSFCSTDNSFTRVFSFEAEESDNVRELFDKHDIKIMDVDDSGNINFIVYGYMNRGKHEGEMGVSLCSYDSAENNVSEKLYIPVNVPFDELSKNVGEVAYISDRGVFYILLDKNLYSVDLTSKEVMVEISGINDQTYAVSEDGTALAYSLSGKLYDTDVIRIFNMKTGSDHQIRAEQGDRLRVLGYIRNDCIIGQAHKSDIIMDATGNITFPMYMLRIYDNTYNVIKEYHIEGVYVSNASVAGMRINLTRVIKTEGGYESTSIDQLMNREENISTNQLTLDTATSTDRKREVYFKPSIKINSTATVSTRTSEKMIFVSGEIIKLELNFDSSQLYFVYGFGKFQGSYSNLANAVAKAYETYGTVIDSEAKYIWKRYKDTTGSVKQNMSGGVDPSQSLAQSVRLLLQSAGTDADAAGKLALGMTAVDIIDEATAGRTLNLNGVNLENVLYYLSVKRPVIGKTGSNTYVVLTAYDSKNLTYLDVSSGKMNTILLSDAGKIFTQWGNVFLTYR